MKSLSGKYHIIHYVEFYIFPVTRISDGSSVSVDYFQSVNMEMVAELSRKNNVVMVFSIAVVKMNGV
jgi:hypothetical protein